MVLPLLLAVAVPVQGVPLGLPAERLRPAAEEREDVLLLGRRLFFDPILSSDRTIACASCHSPDHGFADVRPLSVGVHGRRTLRNAPTLYNRVLGEAFMWDGRARTLEEQVLQPIENELEMDLALDDAVARLVEEEAYVAAFEEALEGPPTEERLAAALAGFVRAIWNADSGVDRFRVGDYGALSDAARSGMWLFESRGGCWRCHSGANFTDEDFHNTGVGDEDGRLAVTGDEADRGRFKTPTLRGVAETGPYMHDGSLATLADVVAFYREGGRANANLDAKVRPIDMTDEDAANLVAFLEALSGSAVVAVPASAPIDLSRGVPLVRARVGALGERTFVLDTGRLASRVSRRLAVELGVDGDTVRVEGLEVDGVHLPSVDALVAEVDVEGADGALGLAAFAPFLATIDLAGGRLTLRDGALPEADGREVLDYFLCHGDSPAVTMRIAGWNYDVHVDTTSSAAVGLPERERADLPLGGDALEGSAELGTLFLESPTLEFGEAFAHPRVGLGLLEGMALTFDQANRRVRLVPTTR